MSVPAKLVSINQGIQLQCLVVNELEQPVCLQTARHVPNGSCNLSLRPSQEQAARDWDCRCNCGILHLCRRTTASRAHMNFWRLSQSARSYSSFQRLRSPRHKAYLQPPFSSARPVAGLTSQVASRGEPVAFCHAHPLGSAGAAVGLAMEPDLIRPLETSRRQFLRVGDMSEIVSHPSHCAFGLDELSRCNLFLTFFSDPPCLLFSVFCSTSCSLFSSQLQSNCHKHSLISWRIHDLSPMIIRV
jgi:hypothetical protein